VDVRALLEQAGLAILFYTAVLLIVRPAGKRLAGQTTTFDLVGRRRPVSASWATSRPADVKVAVLEETGTSARYRAGSD
jgi:uncharacterized membrane protein YcaP (DUF421 family)